MNPEPRHPKDAEAPCRPTERSLLQLALMCVGCCLGRRLFARTAAFMGPRAEAKPSAWTIKGR